MGMPVLPLPERVASCACGCGHLTTVASASNARLGYVKGRPRTFCRGHNSRIAPNNKRTDAQYEIDPQTGCWVWRWSVTSAGYGHFQYEGRVRLAHVVYYERAHGPVPVGFQVDHLCKRPLCVNPQHLEAVTPAVNTYRSRAAKLTSGMRRFLKERFAVGWTHKALATACGVHTNTVGKFLRGKTWLEA